MLMTVGAEEVQPAAEVRSCVLLSEYVPVAVYCWVEPGEIEMLLGVTAIETGAEAVTFSDVELFREPNVAVITLVPCATAVAKPLLLMVATVAAEDAQVTVLVRFWVLPSVYLPVAVNCCVNPLATAGFAGVTAIEAKVGAVTVSVVESFTEPKLARIVVAPGATVVASPELLTVATVTAEEFQLTVLVRSCVLPSAYVPVAVNCCGIPLATVGFRGVTAIDVSMGR